MHYDGAAADGCIYKNSKISIHVHTYIYREGSGGKIMHARTENYPAHSTVVELQRGHVLKAAVRTGTDDARGPKWKTDGGKR